MRKNFGHDELSKRVPSPILFAKNSKISAVIREIIKNLRYFFIFFIFFKDPVSP